MVHLLVEDISESWGDRLEVLARRVCAVLVHALVSRVARSIGEVARELPGQPVHDVEDLGGLRVQARGAFEELEGLRQQHLGREHAAVAGQPGLAALSRDVDDASGLRSRTVVLPQLEVCLRFAREFLAFAHGHPGLVGEDDRCTRAVQADAHHGGGVDARVRERSSYRFGHRHEVVAGYLQREVGGEGFSRRDERAVHDGGRVLADLLSERASICRVDDGRAHREGAKVEAENVAIRHWRSPCLRGSACPSSRRAQTACRRRRRAFRYRSGRRGWCTSSGSSGP